MNPRDNDSPKSNEDREPEDAQVPDPAENAYPADDYWESETREKGSGSAPEAEDPADSDTTAKRGPPRPDNGTPGHVQDS